METDYKIYKPLAFLGCPTFGFAWGPKENQTYSQHSFCSHGGLKNGKWTIFVRKSLKKWNTPHPLMKHTATLAALWDFVTPGTITNFVLISPCSDAELNPKPQHLIRWLLRIYVGSSIMRGSYHAFMYLNMSECIPDLVEGCCGWLTQIPQSCMPQYMEVSWNGGTPKWMVYKGKSIYKWKICGYLYFRKPP